MSNYRRWRVEGGTYFFRIVTDPRQAILTGRLRDRITNMTVDEDS